MVEGSDYKDARDATIRAARDLYEPPAPTARGCRPSGAAAPVTANLWACSGTITPANGPTCCRTPASRTARWVPPKANRPITDIVNVWGFQRSGTVHAYMRGYGTTGTDVMWQKVTVLAGSPKLTFYLLVDSAEGSSTTAFDNFKAQVQPTAGSPVTVATSSNVKWDDSYHRFSVNMTPWAGQVVLIKFFATEDSSLQTGFMLDDLNLR